ncbi:MAG: hypothetical protein JNK30_14705 [Phenylobacterium sp.]|uniref:hypothetical protein n=1 Tax=Phenylobacterium sp. TaxID=1871053 RepID=UPI001A544FD6|nr:hypothetical protein [Phenylobacterium sp.]MBL8772630.1 hypothetical protein [Phenylobacterium sp.]
MLAGKQTWVGPTILAAIAVLVVGGLGARYLRIHQMRVDDAKAWAIEGPPCPQITEAELLAAPRGLRRSDYGEVSFERSKGEMECATIFVDGGRGDASYPVCQFDRPSDLRVRTARGEWRFRPGPGRPATVSTRDGVARCVLATARAPA